jgi:hypothetical protein
VPRSRQFYINNINILNDKEINKHITQRAAVLEFGMVKSAVGNIIKKRIRFCRILRRSTADKEVKMQ